MSESHYKRMERVFKNDVFPIIGNKPINDVTAKDIIFILKSMMRRNVRNSAQKVHQSISKTFKWAVANDKAERNPANDIDLAEIVGKSTEQHYPTMHFTFKYQANLFLYLCFSIKSLMKFLLLNQEQRGKNS